MGTLIYSMVTSLGGYTFLDRVDLALDLVESRTFGSGVVVMRYATKR